MSDLEACCDALDSCNKGVNPATAISISCCCNSLNRFFALVVPAEVLSAIDTSRAISFLTSAIIIQGLVLQGLMVLHKSGPLDLGQAVRWVIQQGRLLSARM
ncbi:MAG: hypothetical protein EBS53_14075 [Bacteroidetes bacterium]|nr:hypothetical protein [Bacteroidota bacterium]